MDFIYVFLSPEEFGKYKVGISNRPDLRKKQVGKKVVWMAFMPLPCIDAKKVETACHRILKPYHSPVNDKGGSGGTEWFWSFNVFGAIAFVYFVGFDIWALAVLLSPYPIDGVLLVIAMWGLQMAVLIGIIWLLFYLSTI